MPTWPCGVPCDRSGVVLEFGYQVRFERDKELRKRRAARRRALRAAARGAPWLSLASAAVVYGLGKKTPRHLE
jgi:hypothetical protein